MANRINYKYAGRQILENKLRRLSKMNDEEIQECHNYLRDEFLSKYIPTRTPKRSLESKAYEPVVKITAKR